MASNTINNDKTVAGNAEGTLLAGRYRVVRQLGAGGMGSVWLAEDTQLDNKQFAIKMLPSILVSNKRAYRQLKDEALVAMQLVHPNIVQIRAFEENNGNPFLVMDYVDGETLDDYLAEHCGDVLTQSRRDAEGGSRVEHVERVEGEVDFGRDARPARPSGGLPEEEVVRLLKPIAAALDYAHSKGVVHRDVKPGNVMIAKDGTPYILDFGIAREIQETMTRVTGKLSSGTLLYMSPEQLNGDAPKPAQDIYSFAAMAYECLKGEPPFSRGQIEFQILNNPPPPLNPYIAISGLVMRGLEKKPEDRPKTCVAVLEGDVLTQRRRGPSEWRGDRTVPTGGARSSRPLSDNERKGGGAGRALVAAALFVAIVGGAWWWMKEGAKGTDRTDGTDSPPVASVPPVVSVPPVASDPSPKPDEAEDWAKAEAVKIRIEAKVEQDRVTRISDADGFDSRKNTLADVFARAEALFDEKVKRWGEAAQGFSNYVAQCVALRRLDVERLSAVSVRDRATEAKRKAESVDAKEYAETRWREANDLMEKGVDEFGQMHFVESVTAFASAAGQFGKCESEAKDERARRDDEARKERERQDRELQAKIRTALESAREYASGGKWQQCVGECDTVLGWDNANVEAKRLKAEAESHLVPTAKVVVKVNGTELKDGETVRIGPTEWKTPIVWGSKSIKEGKTYGGEVVYEKDGKTYAGRLENFKVDWHGNRNFEVALKRAASLNGDKKSNEESRHKGVQLWEGGPYWADRNIGAENPWDYGYYFWWGGTVGYKRVGNAWVASDGSSSDFSFRGPSMFSKLFGRKANIPTSGKNLADLRNEGWITQTGALAPEHDAAHVHWGGNWRMPSEQELSDLNNNCDWIWTQKNGVNGCEVRGRSDYASNSIFIPCAGYGNGFSIRYAGSYGCYWSSDPRADYYRSAWGLDFASGGHDTDGSGRDDGRSVRPVQGFTK